MTPISSTYFHFSTFKNPVVLKAVETALKLSDCAIAVFQALQGALIILIPVRETAKGNNFCSFCTEALDFTHSDQFERLAQLNGYCLIASGVCGALGALNEIGMIAVGVGASVLNPASLAFFVGGKLFSLTYSSILFYRASQNNSCTRLKQISKIHLLGSLNALGYIVAVASSVFRGPFMVAAVAGGAALSAGGMKIIYELFYYSPLCKFN
jgi:hypothetical protein